MRRKRRKRSGADATYVCPSCGETIEIALDRSNGVEQEYVEDCPVCCRPNLLSIEFDEDGLVPPRVRADPE